MTDDDITDLLRKAVHDAMPDRAAELDVIDLDMELRDLGISSVVAMQIIGYVEDSLADTFRREELANVRRLADIAALIRRRSAGVS